MQSPGGDGPFPDIRRMSNDEWWVLRDRVRKQARIERARAALAAWTTVARWSRTLVRALAIGRSRSPALTTKGEAP